MYICNVHNVDVSDLTMILFGAAYIMHNNSEIKILEVYDGTLGIKLPERSELYSLKPIGLGTAMCESLISWISRLSSLYQVTNAVLIRSILKDSVRLSNNLQQQALNGMNELTLTIVNILETKSHRTDLSYLTTLTWRGSFSSDQLLRKYKYWCPDCFDNWKSNSQVAYEPLIWSISLVQQCPIHFTRLINKCPACEKKLDMYCTKNKIGYCNYCTAWLGTKNKLIDDSHIQTEFERYTVSQISELIKNAPHMTHFPVRNRMNYLFRKLLQDITGGNKKKFARLCGFANKSNIFQDYLINNLIPCLKKLILISYSLNIPIIDLLFSNLEIHQFVLSNPNLATKRERKIRIGPIKISSIEGHIDKMLSGQSPILTAKELCNEYDISYYLLMQNFGEKIKSLIDSKKKITLLKKDEIIRQVVGVTEDLYNKGIYPSYRNVIKNTSGELSFNTEVRNAYLQKLKELGISQRVN